MAGSTQTFRASINRPTTPSVEHVSVLANTEYTHNLTGTVKKLLIQNYDSNASLRVAYVANGTDTTDEYFVIPPKASRYIEGIEYSGTIYLFSSTAKTVYIEQWQ